MILQHSLAPLESAMQARHTAQWAAGIAFALLLFALGVGLLRARKQAQRDEVDRLLEADFRRLERAFDEPPSLPGGGS